MMRHSFIPAFMIALASATASSRGDVVTIGSVKDTTIFAAAPNNSDGGGPGMFAGTDSGGGVLRGLIKFEIAGAVPAGATISDVQLTMTLGMVAGFGQSADATPRSISLYRAASDWGDGTNGSSFATINGTGAGFAAQGGDATWNARFFDPTTPTNWTTAGGDASITASSAMLVSQTLAAFTWPSTAQLVADAQSWLDMPANNLGWLMRGGSESTAKTFRAFWTREATNATLRPALQITYTVPEPTGAVLLLGLLVLKRRRTA